MTLSRPVVTLFESYGSGASYIGPRVAQALGVPFHSQAFSSEELENAETNGRTRGCSRRVFAAMGGSYAGIEGPPWPWPSGTTTSSSWQNTRAVQEEARQGGVIMGRNGALILANRPAALHVMLDGPLNQRIERAARDSGIDLERAAKRQKREDQVRADMSHPALRLGPPGHPTLRPGGQHRNHGPGHLRRDHRPGRPHQGRATAPPLKPPASGR